MGRGLPCCDDAAFPLLGEGSAGVSGYSLLGGHIHVVLADSKRFGGWLRRGVGHHIEGWAWSLSRLCCNSRAQAAAAFLFWGCSGTAESPCPDGAADLEWNLTDGRKHGSLREGGWKNGGARDAAQEARHAEVWQGRKGRTGDEQEAGDRDWAFGSAQEGREGSAEEIQLIARCSQRAQRATQKKPKTLQAAVVTDLVIAGSSLIVPCCNGSMTMERAGAQSMRCPN